MSPSHGQVALVTGASSGIGKAAAVSLIRAGFITYATARRIEALDELHTTGCHTLQLDVTDEASMVAAVCAIEAEHGAVDVLVNNAGYGLNGPVEELDMHDLRREFETNVFGLVRMAQLVLPSMRSKKYGRIINIGSIGGTFTAPGAGAYHASKYAVEAFSDAMRYEVQSFGVDVVLLQPTGVHTPFAAKISATMRDTGSESPYAFFKQNMDRVVTRMFSGRSSGIVQAEDVATVIVHAAQVERPRTRYKVGRSAYVYTTMRRVLSDRAWDRLMGFQFPMQARRTSLRVPANNSFEQ